MDVSRGHHLAQCCGIFYQNDLFYENIRSQLSAYADDHQIYISGEKIDSVVTAVLRRTGIQLVAGINPTTSRVIHRKSKLVLVMSRAKREVKKAVHIDGHTIRQAQEVKLRGLILDLNLQFSEHIKRGHCL